MAGASPSVAHRGLAAAAGRGPPLRGHPRRADRGDRAPRQLGRRLHRARGRRRDAGAPRCLPAHRPAVPSLRPADPPHPRRRPGHALLLVVPAPATAASGRRPSNGSCGPPGRRRGRVACGTSCRSARARSAHGGPGRRAGRCPGRDRSDGDPALRDGPPRDRHLRHPRRRVGRRGPRRAHRPGRHQRGGQDDAAAPRRRHGQPRRRARRAQDRPHGRPAQPGGEPGRRVRGRARPAHGGPWRRRGPGSRRARAGPPGSRRGGGGRLGGLCRGAPPVRGTRRLRPGPAGGGHAVRPGVRDRRLRPAADEPVGRGADPRGAGSPADRRPRPPAARRADQPPRRGGHRVARAGPRPARSRRHRRLARPGLPRRGRAADLGAARPPPARLPRRLLRLPHATRGGRRTGPQGRRVPRRRDRPRAGAGAAVPQPPQVRQDARARTAPGRAPGDARRGAQATAVAGPLEPGPRRRRRGAVGRPGGQRA